MSFWDKRSDPRPMFHKHNFLRTKANFTGIRDLEDQLGLMLWPLGASRIFWIQSWMTASRRFEPWPAQLWASAANQIVHKTFIIVFDLKVFSLNYKLHFDTFSGFQSHDFILKFNVFHFTTIFLQLNENISLNWFKRKNVCACAREPRLWGWFNKALVSK